MAAAPVDLRGQFSGMLLAGASQLAAEAAVSMHPARCLVYCSLQLDGSHTRCSAKHSVQLVAAGGIEIHKHPPPPPERPRLLNAASGTGRLPTTAK